MKAASTALQTALYTSSGVGVAEAWDFYLADGTRHWTSWPVDVTFGGTTWLSGICGMKKGKLFCKTGTSVDSIEVVLFGSLTIGGVSLSAAGFGLSFSEVRAVYSRVYFANPAGTPTERVVIFDGIVQGIRPETGTLTLEVKSPLSRAEQNRGSRLVQITCPFSVNDTDCGAAVQDATGTVASGSTTSRINLVSLPSTAAVGSRLTFTSGALNGIVGQIRAVHNTTPLYVDLTGPLVSAPAAGVTVTIRRGCDKTRSTCHYTFNNIARLGAAPDQPATEMI